MGCKEGGRVDLLSPYFKPGLGHEGILGDRVVHGFTPLNNAVGRYQNAATPTLMHVHIRKR